MKIKIIKANINIKIPRIKDTLNSPVLPNCNVLTKAPGKLATIPAVIINEIPFPKPWSDIFSPNHITNTVPVTRVTMVTK